MKNEIALRRGMKPWDLRITYFNFILFLNILHVEGVNGIVTTIDNLYFEVCYYYRQRFV